MNLIATISGSVFFICTGLLLYIFHLAPIIPEPLWWFIVGLLILSGITLVIADSL